MGELGVSPEHLWVGSKPPSCKIKVFVKILFKYMTWHGGGVESKEYFTKFISEITSF